VAAGAVPEGAAPAKIGAAAKVAAAAPEKAASRPAVADSRFVVQVGAFADTAQVRDLRSRLDKLGLRKHYVQAADSKGGQRVNRVRLGPFGSRDEADRAAARLKEAGLPGQVFEL
jgi:DedD protein